MLPLVQLGLDALPLANPRATPAARNSPATLKDSVQLQAHGRQAHRVAGVVLMQDNSGSGGRFLRGARYARRTEAAVAVFDSGRAARHAERGTGRGLVRRSSANGRRAPAAAESMYVIWPDNVDPVSNSYFSDRQAIWSDLQGLTGTTPGFPYVVQADGAIINWPPESPTP